MNVKKLPKKLLFQAPALGTDKETTKSDYSFEFKLGDGAFGQVWRAKHKKLCKLYACKQVSKDKVIRMLDQFKRELLIMYKLDHPNIIKLYHHFEDTKYFFLLMELAEGGNLFQKLTSSKVFTEKVAFEYFNQVLSAVEYLHSHVPAIIHRDIKPENILIDKNGSLKLTDFGWSNYYEEQQGVPRYTMCGTYEYLAPEMIQESGHTPAVDVWCLGILLYEMLCGHTPFKASSKEGVLDNILKSKIKFPRSFSPSAKDLILQILEKVPQKRISIEKIKQHQWCLSYNLARSLDITLQLDSHKDSNQPKENETKLNILYKTQCTDNKTSSYNSSVRTSTNQIKQDVLNAVENGKNLKEKNIQVNKILREKNRLLKLTEQKLLKKKVESLDIDHSTKELLEYISDENDKLQKLNDNIDLTATKNEIEAIRTKLSEITAKIETLSEKNKDLAGELDLITDNYSDRERYLNNLQQHLKKLKVKGSSLHQDKYSQVSILKTSCEFLKNQLSEHDKILDFIETPETKSYRELMNYIKINIKKLGSNYIVEEKLKNIEDGIYLKELLLEKLGAQYIEDKNLLLKANRADKERILKKSLENRKAYDTESQEYQRIKSDMTEKIFESRQKEKKYLLASVGIDSARETAIVIYTQDLKTKLISLNSAINKLKIEKAKSKSIVLQRKDQIENTEMELGSLKATILAYTMQI
jgi:serine/threonine protein kinase